MSMFVLLGLGHMALLVRIPEIKKLLAVSSSELGLILFAGAVGSIIALSIAARLIARFGTKPQLMFGFFMVGSGLAGCALAATMHSPFWYVACNLILGFGAGISDVPLNVDGSVIEAKKGKSVLPRLHAGFSVGALVGAAVGTVCIQLQIPLLAQMLLICVLQIIAPFATYKFVPAHTAQDDHHRDETAAKPEHLNAWRDKRILFLGLGILCITLAEGAANDWLALSVVEGYEETATNGGIAFAVFNLAMTITRFFGGNLADRFGRRLTVQAMALTGALGLLLVVFGPAVGFAWVGAALWGIGAALGFPLFISEAGEGENAARKVTVVTTFGYFAFLVGPPSLGFVAQGVGILPMLLFVAALLSIAAFFAQSMSAKKS
jgi:MFS family permease